MSEDPALSPDGRIGPHEYRAEMRRGVAHRRAQEDAVARAIFVHVYRRSQRAQALTQLALAEQALGMHPAAVQHLGEALACDDDPWIASHRTVLEAELAGLQALPEPAPGELRQWPDGRPAPGPEPGARRTSTEGRFDLPGIVLTAVGGATVAAGFVTFGLQRGAQSDLEDACPDRRRCTRPDLHDRARRLAVATDVLFVSGLSMATAGLLLWLVAPDETSDDPDGVAASPRVRVGAACGPDGCGVAVGGSF